VHYFDYRYVGLNNIRAAHRIKTVMDYDRILVLDQGKIAEFGTPGELLKKPVCIWGLME
jgi:ABC-type multidrug transport system fused ATPase/permease subunit